MKKPKQVESSKLSKPFIRKETLGILGAILSFNAALIGVTNYKSNQPNVVKKETLKEKEEVKENQILRFKFADNFTEKEKARYEKIVKIVESQISYYLPVERIQPREIKFIKSNQEHLSVADNKKGTITIGLGEVTDGLIVHELVHIYHGEYDTHVNFLEEGIAVAISNLICKKTGLDSWEKINNIQINSALMDGGMSQMSYVQYSSYPPLLNYRYHYASKIWENMEADKPGSIKEIHNAYYDYLDAGGKKEDLFGTKLFDAFKQSGHIDLFTKHSTNNPVMRFNPEVKDTPIVYAVATDIRINSTVTRKVELMSVTKNSHGFEQHYPAQFNITVTNLETNQDFNKSLHAPDGIVNINLEDLSSYIGSGDHYKVSYSTSNQNQGDFEFKL